MADRYPNIMTVDWVIKNSQTAQVTLSTGEWAPARPLGYPTFRRRLHAAWLVFTGRADALTWTEQ